MSRRPDWDRLECRRLLNASSLDPTFGQGGVTTTDFPLPHADAQITSEVIDSSGRIVAAGYFYDADGNQRTVLARYNPDGSLDTTFGDGGTVITPFDAYSSSPNSIDLKPSVAIDTRGRILVASAGYQGPSPVTTTNFNPDYNFSMACYFADGHLDRSFGDQGVAAVDIGYTDSDGNTVETSDVPCGIAVQPGGKIVVAGTTSGDPATTSSNFAVIQLNPDGSLDTTFGADGRAIADFPAGAYIPSQDQAYSLALSPQGQIVVVGSTFNDYSLAAEYAIARFTPDGNLDPSFGDGGEVVSDLGQSPNGPFMWDVADSVVIQPDGKIVVGGEQHVYSYPTPAFNFALLRLQADGSLDPSFGTDGVVTTTISGGSTSSSLGALALQGDGKIVAVGWNEVINIYPNTSPSNDVLVRYNGTDGSLDPSFGQDGVVATDPPTGSEYGLAVVIRPSDGEILVGGDVYNASSPYEPSDFAVTSFNPDGSRDTGFGTDGTATTAFTGSRYDTAQVVATLPDGKIVVAGISSVTGLTNLGLGGQDWALAEYNPDGTLNTAFGQGGRVITPFGVDYDFVSGIAIQPDGKIVVSGTAAPYDGFNYDYSFGLARYNPDGSLDTSFGDDGQVTISFGSGGLGEGVAIQPDGKIIEVGYDFGSGPAIVRVDPDGSLDPSFGDGGEAFTNAVVPSVVLVQPDGKIVVGGGATDSSDFGLARFNPDGSVDTSFGDGGSVETASSYGGISALALQPDGKIVAVGTTEGVGPTTDFQTVRYDPDGSLDPSFGDGGIVITDLTPSNWTSAEPNTDDAFAVLIQPDGKIVVGGTTYNAGAFPDYTGATPPAVALVRYDATGQLDPRFGDGGIAITGVLAVPTFTSVDLALQTDGRILAAYTSQSTPAGGGDFGLARFRGMDLTVTVRTQGVAEKPLNFTGRFIGQATADTTGATWTFGDGSSLSFPSASAPGALDVQHTYEESGTYTITLTVQFPGGGSLTTSTQVEIRAHHGPGDDRSEASVYGGLAGLEADPVFATPGAQPGSEPTVNALNLVDGAIAAMAGGWSSDSTNPVLPEINHRGGSRPLTRPRGALSPPRRWGW